MAWSGGWHRLTVSWRRSPVYPRPVAELTAGATGVAESGARLRARSLVLGAPAWTITAVAGLLYVLIAPASADLAAAAYRSELFGRVGFTVWDNGWFGGHHLPAYSVIAPALGWLVGPLILTALSLTIAVALFAALIQDRFPARAARIAAVWFALGAAVGL